MRKLQNRTVEVHDLVLLVSLLAVLFAIVLVGVHMVTTKITTCTNNPLKYFVDDLKDRSTVETVLGSMNLLIGNDVVDTIYFGDYNSNFVVDVNFLNISG